jgi:hypothetical protein
MGDAGADRANARPSSCTPCSAYAATLHASWSISTIATSSPESNVHGDSLGRLPYEIAARGGHHQNSPNALGSFAGRCDLRSGSVSRASLKFPARGAG